MEREKWMEIEYGALRNEILKLIDSQQAATRFFLPAAAAIYSAPYLLNRTWEALVWEVCAGGAALMVLAMSYTLLAYVQGLYKVRTYIKVAIEDHAAGGWGWETFLFNSQTKRRINWPPEHVVICLVVVGANLAAALGAGRLFLGRSDALKP